MNVEQAGTALTLTVTDGELSADRTLIARLTDLAYQIPCVSTVHVVISPEELRTHRKLFSTRWAKTKRGRRLEIRNEHP